MALWNGLGQAATVAQLAGVDAGGLISMIIQAVQTVHRNKEECRQLVHYVMIIADLLQLLQQSEMMRRPEIKRPLDGLEDTLRQACMLVMSCQQSNIMYRFLMAGNQAQKFRDVRDRIDSYLRIYPLISHIDTRYFISRTHPSGSQPQASEDMLGSFTTLSNPDSRTEGSASDDIGIESVEVQQVTEPFAVEEQQEYGYGNPEVLQNRRHRFRWLVRWAQRETSTTRSIRDLIGNGGTGGITIFKFSQLAASTNNFSFQNRIGGGGFGKVYKGVLPDGVDVAIKICHMIDRRTLYEFENEVQILPKLQHANIVKLLGCCIEGNKQILVYEYMPRGSLYDILHEPRAGVSLTWPVRFQIIEGIAQGAVYLHQHSRLRVIHGDIKPSNMLLDCDMTPRIADFGLAKVLSSDEDYDKGTMVAGTFGYIDPEYARTGIISTKSDVYSFGATFLEIVTGQRALILERPTILHRYAWKLWSSGRAMELIDPSLRNEPGISEILRCIQIALLCTQFYPADRPTMSDVLKMLKCESMTLPVPRQPPYVSSQGAADSSADASETTGSASYTGAEPTIEEESSLYFSCCSSDVDNEDTRIIA